MEIIRRGKDEKPLETKEAPERIWLSNDPVWGESTWRHPVENGVEYIRADLVKK